ncbi:hypothetical protein BG000_007692 [Podila horticola]|nr:hypothetical protein BG000_007692 [Podila horticola]
MAELKRSFQKFKSKDGTELTSLQCHICEETGKQYILWTDIRQAFDGVVYLQVYDNYVVLFMTANNGELAAGHPPEK